MAKSKKNTVEIVTELVTPITSELELILWDVLFEKEGSSWNLKILIDSPNGISFSDCENVSRTLDKLLDEVDPIEQSYYLEVSSAGLNRRLRKESHFISSIGKTIDIKLIRAESNEREFTGELICFNSDVITIKAEKELKFNLVDCASVKIHFDM